MPHQVGYCRLLLSLLAKLWPIIRDPDSRVWVLVFTLFLHLVTKAQFFTLSRSPSALRHGGLPWQWLSNFLCWYLEWAREKVIHDDAWRKQLSGYLLCNLCWGCPTSQPLSRLQRRRTVEHPSPDLCWIRYKKQRATQKQRWACYWSNLLLSHISSLSVLVLSELTQNSVETCLL